ncbi:Putative cysteine-rich receptor-like protein kinase [Arachis hypogaea]|nr:Putative cysteine-rich receptor-like protein kinase [Arachis hypogaea]
MTLLFYNHESPSILKLSLRLQVLSLCCAGSKAINDPKGHESHGVHLCHKCRWPFPNPHPSAKHRRAHKKICGTIEGPEVLNIGNKEKDDSEIGDKINRSEDEAWRLWCEERPLELIDESLTDSVAVAESEVLRCIHIGLLCVQERPENRPDMSAIVLMLNGEKPLPRPRDLLFIHISLAFHQGIVQ